MGALEWQLWLLWFALGLWGALYMVEQRVEVAVLLTLEVEAESGTQSVQFGDLVSVVGERAPLLIKVQQAAEHRFSLQVSIAVQCDIV